MVNLCKKNIRSNKLKNVKIVAKSSEDYSFEKADLIIWDLDSLIDIPYYISNHPIQKVIKNGNIVFGA